MKETKSKRITLVYCRKMLERHPLPGDRLENSNVTGPKELAHILKSSDANSRFMVSWDPDSYHDDEEDTSDSWDLIGPGSPYGNVYYISREDAEKDRDALNNILREHFGNVTRTAEYTNDAYLAKSLLDCPCCPACGSTHTDSNEHRFVGASCAVYKGCHDCHAEWTESYALSGYKDLRLD